jgi:hypothetical protein
MRAIRTGVGAIVAACAAMIAALVPSRETLGEAAASLWRNRGVRRCGGLAGGLAALAVLSWVMLHNMQAEERYRVDPGRIELAAAPTWATGSLAAHLKAEIEDDLRADLADLPETSAFDEQVMQQVSHRVELNPWVKRVVRIERRFPAEAQGYSRLLVALEVRTPAVAVETGERHILIDGDGVVLPLELHSGDPERNWARFVEQLARPLRVVRGIEGAVPEAGEAWGSEQVAAALSMERVIRKSELDKSLPIDAIELIGIPQLADARGRVHYQAEGGVVLIPDQTRMPGTRLIWGRPPVHASTLELSPNEKLEQLKARLRTLDSVSGARIDLRFRA